MVQSQEAQSMSRDRLLARDQSTSLGTHPADAGEGFQPKDRRTVRSGRRSQSEPHWTIATKVNLLKPPGRGKTYLR